MPIENERKYVMDETVPDLADRFAALPGVVARESIWQGYAEGAVAVALGAPGDPSACLFSFERPTRDGLFAVRRPISRADFENLWPMLEPDPEGARRVGAERLGRLTDDGRIRHAVEDGGESFVFAYKRMSAGGLVEIEEAVPRDRFAALRGEVAAAVSKRRVKVEDAHGLHWDVDFLADGDGVYVAAAEVEMPTDPWMEEPPALLAEVAANLLFAVPRGDGRFTNRRLSDPAYARALVASLRAGPSAQR